MFLVLCGDWDARHRIVVKIEAIWVGPHTLWEQESHGEHSTKSPVTTVARWTLYKTTFRQGVVPDLDQRLIEVEFWRCVFQGKRKTKKGVVRSPIWAALSSRTQPKKGKGFFGGWGDIQRWTILSLSLPNGWKILKSDCPPLFRLLPYCQHLF